MYGEISIVSFALFSEAVKSGYSFVPKLKLKVYKTKQGMLSNIYVVRNLKTKAEYHNTLASIYEFILEHTTERHFIMSK